MNRRNFLQRIAVLAPALMLVDRFKTPEPLEFEGLQAVADREKAMRDAHPMRYARVSYHWRDGQPFEAWLEYAPSPDGPFVRSHRVPVDQPITYTIR